LERRAECRVNPYDDGKEKTEQKHFAKSIALEIYLEGETIIIISV